MERVSLQRREERDLEILASLHDISYMFISNTPSIEDCPQVFSIVTSWKITLLIITQLE